MTPFMGAARRGLGEITELFLDHDDFDFMVEENGNISNLMDLVSCVREDWVQQLLLKCLTPDAGKSPSTGSVEDGGGWLLLLIAVERDSAPLMKTLLDIGFDMGWKPSGVWAFPGLQVSRWMEYTSSPEHWERALGLAIDHGFDVNARDGNGMTLLWYAGLGLRPGLVKGLMSHGADTTVRHGRDRSLLDAVREEQASLQAGDEESDSSEPLEREEKYRKWYSEVIKLLEGS